MVDLYTVLTYVIITDAYTSSKAKRARAGQVKHKSTITMYNKMAEMISNLSELLEIQELTDTTILQVFLRNRNLFLEETFILLIKITIFYYII